MFKFFYKKDSDTTEMYFHVNFEVIISAVLGSGATFEAIKQLLMNIQQFEKGMWDNPRSLFRVFGRNLV